MARQLKVEKLNDEGGVYSLIMRCGACGHERTAEPLTLGRLCGWTAKLTDVATRLRCSKCGKKDCSLRAIPPPRRR